MSGKNQNSGQGDIKDVSLTYFNYHFCPFKRKRDVDYSKNKSWKRNSDINPN